MTAYECDRCGALFKRNCVLERLPVIRIIKKNLQKWKRSEKMLELILNEHTVEDFKEMKKLRKMGVPDEIINIGYQNTLKSRLERGELNDNNVPQMRTGFDERG